MGYANLQSPIQRKNKIYEKFKDVRTTAISFPENWEGTDGSAPLNTSLSLSRRRSIHTNKQHILYIILFFFFFLRVVWIFWRGMIQKVLRFSATYFYFLFLIIFPSEDKVSDAVCGYHLLVVISNNTRRLTYFTRK